MTKDELLILTKFANKEAEHQYSENEMGLGYLWDELANAAGALHGELAAREVIEWVETKAAQREADRLRKLNEAAFNALFLGPSGR